MQAVQIVEPGRALEMREVPLPEPGPGEVRVRVAAAGVCHSDVHYRAGTASVARLPITPGHEIAGTIEALGSGVVGLEPGDRGALHYLVSCGACRHCIAGREQFCAQVEMLGKHRDGGYASHVVVPARNVVPVPDGVDLAAAAVMMCSSATALHALRKARTAAGDRVAVFGVGGLGLSGLQLARAMGAVEVYAVDIDPARLALARELGAIPVDASQGSVVEQIRAATGGDGVDVAVEFAGLPVTQEQAVAVLAVQGRAALAGITREAFRVHSFDEVINREAEIIGVSDHRHGDLLTVLEFARLGWLDLGRVIQERIDLDAAAINARLDALARFRGPTRCVIVP